MGIIILQYFGLRKTSCNLKLVWQGTVLTVELVGISER